MQRPILNQIWRKISVRNLSSGELSLIGIQSNWTEFKLQLIAAALAASYHIVVGIGMAYSAILIPSLVLDASNVTSSDQIVATRTESSWIG